MGPVEDAVSGVDLLIVDLPDVGCRYYTYPWTAREVLRLAARHGKPVVLLDRPNPLGGVAIEGSLQDDGADSAVCASPVPVRHGLTFGELALWNQQSWGIDVALTVVAASGWCRELWGDETGLPFVPPSPNLGSFTAVLLYPGTCLIEGTNVSEGRGTDCPFQVVGAPFVDASALARELSRSSLLTGATLREVRFTATSGKWAGEECRGVELDVGDRASFHPVEAGVALIAALRRHNGFAFRAAFDRLAGTSRWREALERGAEPEEIVAAWRTDEDGFRTARAGTLLY
jgi:uncharacterized protein YbbC (DUF1343 family)